MSKPPRASKGDTRSIIAIRKNRIRFVLPSFLSLPLVVLLGTILAVALLYPYTISVHSFNLPKVGEVSKETIISPFTFDIVRLPEELERERKKAEEQVLLVMQYGMENRDEVRKKFIELREIVNELSKKNISDSTKISRNKLLSKELSSSTVQVLMRNPRLINDALSLAEDVLDNGVSAVQIVPSMEKLKQLRSHYNTSFDKYMIYDQNYVTLRKGNYETTVRVSDVPVKEVALEETFGKVKGTQKYDDETLSTLYELLFVYIKPNVQVNSSLTMDRREKASRDILEITGKVIKDSEIVRKHQVITADIVSKLKSLQLAIDKMGNYQERRRIKADNAGRLLLTIIPLLFLAFYIYRFEKTFVKSNKSLLAFSTILVFQLLIIRVGLIIVSRLVESSSEMTALVPEYLIPFATGSILAAILFSPQIAFILTLYVSLVIGIVLGFNQFFFLYGLLTGVVSIYTVRNLRYRLHFFKVIPPVALICIVAISLWHLISFKLSFLSLMENYAFALVSVIVSVFLAMMLTPLFEKLFDLTTDMTLVELSDMNHPILKRLSIEAAGTYNHSVLVGNLAESAAQRIGANALLARVASYYHDIGKIEKSDYFVENCLPVDKNRHNKLAPSMSALIICSHVKDGVELAMQHKLPGVIQDMIMQHHGTSTVSFFYEKALEQDPHKQVQEQDFRYSGPLPQSREAAIIMLADSVEAASRSLGTSSPKLLRELVKKIIRDKFLSSQLDQSDLTLKDLDLIVEGFMPVLQGIFHSRIEYPKGV
jgi:putative nucleotidyltransferase with HDIG domain